jgi:hypothetical protein
VLALDQPGVWGEVGVVDSEALLQGRSGYLLHAEIFPNLTLALKGGGFIFVIV